MYPLTFDVLPQPTPNKPQPEPRPQSPPTQRHGHDEPKHQQSPDTREQKTPAMHRQSHIKFSALRRGYLRGLRPPQTPPLGSSWRRQPMYPLAFDVLPQLTWNKP